jgi:transposase InsO family protein
MARTVAPVDVRMATACVGAVGDVTAFCRAQGISRKTFYKWRRRFFEGGVEGLEPLSRRPVHSPNASDCAVEEEIVRRRKQLFEDGLDAGPETIRQMMLREQIAAPSRATIARILVRRGLVVPAPRKRPKSSLHRFVYARPNECWQSDWTAWWLAGGLPVAIAGTLDDHSRTLVGISAAAGDGTGELVWSVMAEAICIYGVPQRSLSDNGMCYSMARRGHTATSFEVNLRALGCQPITSTPYHPQTCGKIERFWQTLKKWLTTYQARHGAAADVLELNRRLCLFAEYYNTRRPHRALKGRTPAEVFAATAAARPAERPLANPLTVHTGTINSRGVMQVGRYQVHVGRRWNGTAVTAIKDGRRVAIFAGNRLVRAFDVNPDRIYQPAANEHRAH